MKTTIIIVVILLLLVVGWYGKKWVSVLFASDYDNMLDALYSKTIPLLKPEEIKNANDYVILDARALAEFNVSHLEHAIWVNFPNPNLEMTKELAKDQAILVYCSVGYRSERVGEELVKMGFTKVYNLYGGIFEWANNKYPIVNNSNEKTNKVHGYAPSWGKWMNKEIEVVYQ